MYKIMIIEDEQIERETLYKIIQDSFPECRELYAAKNGKEALTMFEEYHPDIILADINIPELTVWRLSAGFVRRKVKSAF